MKSRANSTFPAADAHLNALLVGGTGRFSDRVRTLLKGVGVDDARGATEAVRAMWRPGLDVIVLASDPKAGDTWLRALHGWQAAGLTTPVLAVTGSSEFARCLDAGADDCVTEAIAPAELRARLRALARRAGGKRPALEVADLRIDTVHKTVERAGRSIVLTPREFDLLEFLARFRGRVVSRKMIWERLYGEMDGMSSNVVDVYIRYLRQKIDRGFAQALIKTRWGHGYMLVSDGDEQAA